MSRIWGVAAIVALALLPASGASAQDQNVSLEELEKRLKAAKAAEAQRKPQAKPKVPRQTPPASQADAGRENAKLSPFLGMWTTEGGSILESRKTDAGGLELVYVMPNADIRHQVQPGMRLSTYIWDGYGLRGRSRTFFYLDDNGISCRPQEHDSYIVLKDGALHENATDFECENGRVIGQSPKTWVFRRP